MRILKKHTVSLYGRPGDDGVWYTFCRECSKSRGTIHICNEIIERFPQRVADASFKYAMEAKKKPDAPTSLRSLSRTGDPSTSHEAAASIDPTELEAMVLDAIRESGHKGMTADDLLHHFPKYSYSSITARPSALKRKGLIYDSGEKRLGKSGRRQAVLKAV